MTSTANARLAGFTFLLYIAAGIANMVLFRHATGAGSTEVVLASIVLHDTALRLTALLTVLTGFCAVILGVALYALTRRVDQDLALLALCFRLTEGVVATVSIVRTLGLVSVAASAHAAAGADRVAAVALGGMLLQQGGWTALAGGTCFAMGSALFSFLFLRARSIPVWLAWLGVLASLLLAAVLPLQIAGFLRGPATRFVWIPMLVFEVALALWLLVKGVAPDPAFSGGQPRHKR